MHRLRGCSPTTDPPRGGGRFALSRPQGSPDLVLKQGDPAALRREARGARLAGPPLAPRVLASRAGALTSEWIPGGPRTLAGLDPGGAAALGRVVAAVHGRRATASGALPGWRARVTRLAAYAHGRGRDAAARAAATGERALVDRAAACARAAAQQAPGGPRPFALLHGDLVAANVVWPADGGDPVLVDWEFWRMGDPAEDLAYLVALNHLPATVADGVYRGYGADPSLVARVDLWTPLVLADAGLWLRAHGDPAGGALLDRARDALGG